MKPWRVFEKNMVKQARRLVVDTPEGMKRVCLCLSRDLVNERTDTCPAHKRVIAKAKGRNIVGRGLPT